MGLNLLIVALLAQQSIDVEVRNAATSQVVESAEVVMEGADLVGRTRRPTRANGRATFQVACSEDVKFWAQLRDEPHFPNPSPPATCQSPLVRLKLRPR